MFRVYVIIAVVLAFLILGYAGGQEYKDCEAQGGVLVQQPWGLACVQPIKPRGE